MGINPWIVDFAAYNLWARPVGLLACLDALRRFGASLALLDCLDRTWQDMPWPEGKAYAQGPYPRTRLPAPAPLSGLPRRFSRYGLPYPAVRAALASLTPRPDLVLVTANMTYWYPGAVQVIHLLRHIWPKVPIALGGVYPTLCPGHAQGQEADLVLPGPLEDLKNWARIWQLVGSSVPPVPNGAGFNLALDLYPHPQYAPILGSRGCPYRCAYCASSQLHPRFVQRQFKGVQREFMSQYQAGVRDFAFYDDALLLRPQKWLLPFLDALRCLPEPIRLHAPNALHVQALSPEVCRALYQAGLTTVRLGLESGDFKDRLDHKLNAEQWYAGINNLFQAGFSPEQIGAYVLFGLPDQTEQGVLAAIRLAAASGIRPHLAHYSPLPGSTLFKRACEVSTWPIDQDPLFQNNSIWPCSPGGFSWEKRQFWQQQIEQALAGD